MTLAKTVKYSLHWGEATQVNRLYVLRLLWKGQVGNYHRHRWNVSPQLCLSKWVNLNIIAPSTSPWTHLLCAPGLLHFQCSLCCVTAQPAPLPEHQRKIFLPGHRVFALGIQIRYFLLPLVSPGASFLRDGLRQPLQKFSQSRKSRAFPAPYCGHCCTAGPKHSFRVINTNPCLFSRSLLLLECCQTHLHIKWTRKLAVFLVKQSPRFV